MVHVVKPCPICGRDTSVGLSTDPPLVLVDGRYAHHRCANRPTKLDPVERWRVLFPPEREMLVEMLEHRIEWLRGLDTAVTEVRFLRRMLTQLRELESRPRPETPWWDEPRPATDNQV